MRDFDYELAVKADDFSTGKNPFSHICIDDFEQYTFGAELENVSEELQKRIDEAVIQSKKEAAEIYVNRRWTSMGADEIEFDFLMLSVDITTEGIRYSISGSFHDSIEEYNASADILIPVELPEYDEQVKAMFHKFIDAVFF